MPTPSDPSGSPYISSSRGTGDPKVLLEQTHQNIRDHADLNYAYGLCQPAAGLGVHPWLRDSFATPDEKEPGNASPTLADKTPFAEKD